RVRPQQRPAPADRDPVLLHAQARLPRLGDRPDPRVGGPARGDPPRATSRSPALRRAHAMTRTIGWWIRRLSPLISGLILLVGCSSGPPLVQGTIKAEPAGNPDRGGRRPPILARAHPLEAVAGVH